MWAAGSWDHCKLTGVRVRVLRPPAACRMRYIYSDRIWHQKCSRKSSPAGIQISSDRFCNVCRGWKGLLYWEQFCTMLLSRLGDKSLDVLCTLRSYYIEYRGTAVVLVGSDMDMGPLFETQPTQPIIAIHYKVIDKTQPSKSNVQLQSHTLSTKPQRLPQRTISIASTFVGLSLERTSVIVCPTAEKSRSDWAELAEMQRTRLATSDKRENSCACSFQQA